LNSVLLFNIEKVTCFRFYCVPFIPWPWKCCWWCCGNIFSRLHWRYL